MPKHIPKPIILLTLVLMDLLVGMEFDLFVPSFPELQDHFQLLPFWVTALLSVNFIGYCISLLFVGGLADRYGRKPIILLGLITFVLGSLCCLSTTSYQLLLIGRFLQGVGIAAPSILSFLIIADTYSLKEQQFLMAMLNGSMNVAAAAAPVLGSYITLYFHWQGNFITLLILGLITLLMSMLFIPKYKIKSDSITTPHNGYISVLKSKPLMLSIISLLFIFVPYWIFVGMSPLLYLQDLNVSLKHFGYYQGAFALVFAIGCVIYGLIIKNRNFDQKKMLNISLYMFAVSLILVFAIALLNSHNPLVITLSFMPFIIAQIIPSTLLYPICLNFMPELKGRTSAIIQSGRLIFSAIGLQIAAILYQGSFESLGLVISGFILIAVVLLYFVIKNKNLTLRKTHETLI